MKHRELRHAFEQIYNNAVTIRAEKDVMHLSMCEAPNTSVVGVSKEGPTNTSYKMF